MTNAALSVLFPLLLFPVACLLACKFTKNIRKSARNCQLLPVFMANLLSFAYKKRKISSLDLE